MILKSYNCAKKGFTMPDVVSIETIISKIYMIRDTQFKAPSVPH